MAKLTTDNEEFAAYLMSVGFPYDGYSHDLYTLDDPDSYAMSHIDAYRVLQQDVGFAAYEASYDLLDGYTA